MELHSIDIYANDRYKPTISITYTLKEKREIDMFKMWIREDVAECYEILNYANLLYYEIMINNKNPQEKHIYRAYQMLFGEKLWENYKEFTVLMQLNSSLKYPPYHNFTEFTKDTMKVYTDKELARFTQQARKKYQKLKENM